MLARLRLGCFLALLASAPIFALAGGSDALPDPLKARLDTITIDDLKKYETFLTSDDCAGRDTTQPGLTKARDFLIEHHKKFGLESAAPDGSYLYDFEVPTITWSDDDALTVTTGDEKADGELYKPGVDFVPVRGSGNGSVEGEVVFCGYGIVSAEEKYDDFKGADVKDKVVAVLLHEPREAKKGRPFKGEEWTNDGRISMKGKAAEERGAKAVIVFTDPLNHADQSVLKGEHPRYGARKDAGPNAPKIPVVQASSKVADRIFGAGHLLEWQKSLDQRLIGSPKKIEHVRVRLKVELKDTSTKVQDVVACKRGVDPKLKDEWVVLGAHYDHIGVDDWGRIFHGADDNGSGTSCLLEIAEAIGAQDVAFKRSILLMHFAGEEKGLLGSEAYCKNPLIPPDRTVAMINMDMVGRGRPHDIDAAGLANSVDFQALVRRATALSRARIKVGDGGMQFFERSDQYYFYKVGIPVLFFMEPEEHADYHKVTDTMDKIVYGKIVETGKVVTSLLWLLTEVEHRPKQEGIKR